MSQLLVQQYLNELSDLRRVSGTTREGVVSEAFKDLLKGYAKSHDLIFLNQYELPKQDGNRRVIDGALVYDLRVPFGYWEAKDEEDDLDKEIAAKFRRGYPRDNIIFEDSKTAVLFQYGNEVMRCPVDNTDELPHLLELFFKYERPDKDNGLIFIDTETHLSEFPAEAWTYRLGNRSALEWVLEQHKEKTPKDPTIRARFNNYNFADHKEKVIDLLMRVTRVSVETMEIVEAMRNEKR